MVSKDLNPDKALIFRITHKHNAAQIFAEGCLSPTEVERLSLNTGWRSNYVVIGNKELIAKRNHRNVPCVPDGTLSDYVPFYFTPFTPMLYNIKTGYGGVSQNPMEDIIILVSSLHLLKDEKIPFIFTDRHAYLQTAQFSDDLANLDWIIWETLQARDFRRDEDNIDKFDKYQAEALVYRRLPVKALKGIACYSDSVKSEIIEEANRHSVAVKIHVMRNWYF